MPRHPGPVLVDTNVIFECHRTNSWRALTSGYHLETTEDCVEETQAGYRNREGRTEVDETRLRRSLTTAYRVSDRQLAELMLRQGPALDHDGEAVWTHATDRKDHAWVLSGPAKASLLCGISLRHRERLVLLERLLVHRAQPSLRASIRCLGHCAAAQPKAAAGGPLGRDLLQRPAPQTQGAYPRDTSFARQPRAGPHTAEGATLPTSTDPHPLTLAPG